MEPAAFKDMLIGLGLVLLRSIITPMNSCRGLCLILLFLVVSLTACRPDARSVATPLVWTPLPPSATPDLRTARTSMPSIPSATAILFCNDAAQFLEDLTVPDGTEVQPGESIDKRWSVKNVGGCDWGPGYELVHIGSDPFEGPDLLALYPAKSGANAVWRVELLAPQEPGNYVSRWQARNPEGVVFGDVVYLLVIVPTPTPIPSPSPSPTR